MFKKKQKYNILGITLARGGSKGIKNKNIINLNGKPLIFYTINEAKKSKYLNDYIVSTDSLKILKIAKKFKAETPFVRPKKLAKDKTSSVDALKHAVEFMEKKNKKKYDYIVELMCTNPLKQTQDIDKCIKKIIEKKSDTVIAMHELEEHHPARIKKIVNGKIKDFSFKEKPESRRQDLKPKAYIRSGSIYAIKRDYLMKKNRRYGSNNSYAYILPQKRAINIDDKYSLAVAKMMIKSK